MTFEEAKALARGYAWAMEDAGKGMTRAPHGDADANPSLGFAGAYAQAQEELKDAYRHWQESGGRTVRGDGYATAVKLARRISSALISSADFYEITSSGAALEIITAQGQHFTVIVAEKK